MRVIHTVLTLPSAEVGELMALHGVASPRRTRWTGPADAVLSAFTELQQRGIQSYLIHDFFPDDSDQPDRYGALLSLVPESDANVRDDVPALISSDDEEADLANQALLDLLAPLTKGLEWTRREDGRLWELTHAPRLPDPVSLGATHSFDQGATGLWMIAHDGRMILSDRNLEFLDEHGIAWTDSEAVDGQTYPTASSLIHSGRIADLLLSQPVEFAAPPIYLIDKPTADTAHTANQPT
jgi:hypothetical protein